jgi:glycosyltransferase involved in cell wall biosynthesis
MTHRTLHSIVVPVFDEQDCITEFHDRCVAAMESIGDEFEIVYVDDGSRDDTWRRLEGLRSADARVRLRRLSRNFGQQAAMSAGLDVARGDTIVFIDADLQDPPEVIAGLIDAWRAGTDIVYAVRTTRHGDGHFKRGSARVFNHIFRRITGTEIPLDAGDFRLISRRAAVALRTMPERHRWMRGMVAWIGFPSTNVEYVREKRFAGKTKYSFVKLVALALEAILSFSTMPLRLAIWMGVTASFLALVGALLLVVLRATGHLATIAGWTSTAVMVLFMSGLQLFTLGVLGEYVGRSYDESRSRPVYVVLEDSDAACDPGAGPRPSPRGAV